MDPRDVRTLSPTKLRQRYPPRKAIIGARKRLLCAGEGVKNVTKNRYDKAFAGFLKVIEEVKGVRLSKENIIKNGNR